VTRLLCLCSGNTCRSPMLAALVRAAAANAGSAVEVISAGTRAWPDEPASPGAQRAMARRGLSLADHRSRALAAIDLSTIDRIYAMTTAHAAAARAIAPDAAMTVLNADRGGISDPFGGDDAVYEATAQELELAAREIVDALGH
jgi:protein-tyrosine-phosphatase